MRKTLPGISCLIFLVFIFACNRKALLSFEYSKFNQFGSNSKDDKLTKNNDVIKENDDLTESENFSKSNFNTGLSTFTNSGYQASSNIYANIVRPTMLTEKSTIAFNDISLKGLKNKNVIVNGIGASVKSIYVPRIFTFESVKTANFTIDGEPEGYYSITIPKVISLFNSASSDPILAKTSLTEVDEVLNQKGSGVKKYEIKAKLYISPILPTGVYYSKDFNVIVNLN